MAEQTTPVRDIKADAAQAADRIRSEVDELVNALDFRQMARKIQDFGRDKPVSLAIAALTVGIAAGLLMRKTLESSSGTSATPPLS
jgi:hypothetical protein